MSLYIDNDFYLEIQMLSLLSLLGPGISIELKQVKINIFLIMNTFWGII